MSAVRLVASNEAKTIPWGSRKAPHQFLVVREGALFASKAIKGIDNIAET